MAVTPAGAFGAALAIGAASSSDTLATSSTIGKPAVEGLPKGALAVVRERGAVRDREADIAHPRNRALLGGRGRKGSREQLKLWQRLRATRHHIQRRHLRSQQDGVAGPGVAL